MSSSQSEPGPPYGVQAEPRRDYLRVVLTGVRSTPEVSIAAWAEVARLVREHRARRVLVLSKVTGPLPTPDEQRQIMGAMVGQGFEGVRSALVLEATAQVHHLEHGEMYVRELGHASRVFGSESVAELWLRHGE